MIIKKDPKTSEWQAMVRKYTVRHKDIDRLERMSWRQLPHLKRIKLFYPAWPYILLPHWQFSDTLRPTKKLSSKIAYTGKPTPEQLAIVNNINLFDIRTGIIEMKTGRWKWHVIMQLCDLFQETALIVVHNLTTLQDMVQKFKEFTDFVPWVYSSKKKDIKEITITTHSSFKSATQAFTWRFGVIIIDECDYNFSRDMLRSICTCDWDALFGLSGTPSRKELDINDMQLVFGDIIKYDNQDQSWYNIIPSIDRIEYISDRFYSFENRHDLKWQLINCEPRINYQIQYIKNYIETGKTKYWLLLVERKEQECLMYYERLKSEWIRCHMVNWDTKAQADEENINDILENWWIIIWTVWKVGRWKDIPFLDTIFLFFPNKFESSTIQAVGRWLRSYPWKTWCILVDWCDMPILKAQASSRMNTYTEEYWENVEVNYIRILDYIPTEVIVDSIL